MSTLFDAGLFDDSIFDDAFVALASVSGIGVGSQKSLYNVYIHSYLRPHRRIAQLVTADNLSRSYVLMEDGQLSLSIKDTDYRPNEGDIIVVESRELSPWIGFLNPTERALDGRYSINARGIAAILGTKLTEQTIEYKSSISSGSIFRDIITNIHRQGYACLYMPSIVEHGPAVKDISLGGQTALDALNELNDFTDWEWSIETAITAAKIIPTIQWTYRVGIDASEYVCLRQGIHFTDLRYKRDITQIRQTVSVLGGSGDVKNRASGSAQTATTRLADIPVQLQASRIVYAPDTDNPTTLSARAQAVVNHALRGVEIYGCTINHSFDWSKLRRGNYISVWAYGQLRRTRIVGMQPDEDSGTMELTLET